MQSQAGKLNKETKTKLLRYYLQGDTKSRAGKWGRRACMIGRYAED